MYSTSSYKRKKKWDISWLRNILWLIFILKLNKSIIYIKEDEVIKDESRNDKGEYKRKPYKTTKTWKPKSLVKLIKVRN